MLGCKKWQSRIEIVNKTRTAAVVVEEEGGGKKTIILRRKMPIVMMNFWNSQTNADNVLDIEMILSLTHTNNNDGLRRGGVGGGVSRIEMSTIE